jgi:putative heme-binding domain-containing protein
MQWLDKSSQPWGLEPRKCADGQAVELLSSLPRSEQYTGVLESEVFPCPARLSFWIAGHNGAPEKPDQQRNLVSLVHAHSGQSLAQALPPRSDVAEMVNWELTGHVDQPVRLRIVDGCSDGSFAWLGVARFSLNSLQPGSLAKPLQAASSLIKLGFGDQQLVGLIENTAFSRRQRASLIAAYLEGRGAILPATLTQLAVTVGRSDLVDLRVPSQQFSSEQALVMIQEICRSASGAQQSAIAQALLKSEAGCELLAEVLQAGWLSPAALRGASTLLPKSLDQAKQRLLQGYFEAATAAGLDTTIVAKRLSEMNFNVADTARGKLLFTQHCANCHQLAGQGATIGPQLDGAVQRSHERLTEDILLPNLNVDRAFRATIILLEDGSIVSGLIREESEDTLQMVASDAKPISVAKKDISERKDSEQSLMPANLAELLDNQQLADLLAYLTQSAAR